MTKEEIKDKILKNKEMLGTYRINSIALFGSFVREEQTGRSDIDFLVDFAEPTFRNYIGLLSKLKELFGDNVDLVCKDALKDRIKPYILQEAEWLK